MQQAGVKTVDKIILAGAFGSTISPKHALILGLVPDCDLARVHAVGNAAGDGARIALLNVRERRQAQEVARWVEYVETAVHPDFQEEFVAAMHLPHKYDLFPHLTELLPDTMLRSNNLRAGRKRRRARLQR